MTSAQILDGIDQWFKVEFFFLFANFIGSQKRMKGKRKRFPMIVNMRIA